MELFVVIDTKGSGRLLGAFDSKATAEEVTAISRQYYKMHSIELNKIDPEVLDWADSEEQRTALRELIDKESS